MAYFGRFYLDKEKDILVRLFLRTGKMYYSLETPNHGTGNLISNFAKLCKLSISFNERELKVIQGDIPCYIDGQNRKVWILRFAGIKAANIYPDGTIERKAYIPAIAKTLMSQTKDYKLNAEKTLVKTYIPEDCKFHTDLHTHMNANLTPDILIALGISREIRYPLYYIKKLKLKITKEQESSLNQKRKEIENNFKDSKLTGKYLSRRIDDNTFLNFADLILNNIPDAAYNISKIRASLAIMKDGQAVFTNLEKVYLYRYIFTRGAESDERIPLRNIGRIPDEDIVNAIMQMEEDRHTKEFRNNTIFQDELLWIARTYASHGIYYVEISDTTLGKRDKAAHILAEIHDVMPDITAVTGVKLRFLVAFRRIPLTIIKDQIATMDYFQENLQTLRAIVPDPYIAGSDIVGEEINDIRELKTVIHEIVSIAKLDDSFVIRIHAGENDSLPDNVANSISCVQDSVAPGQKFPHIRIGHGLYTANLNTKKGQKLIKDIRGNNVVLEFQITSNVRLNNLSAFDRHPLKQYLAENILCVQGTDGGALYGTDSIDEQLSLEKMLEFSSDEMLKMRRTEDMILSTVSQEISSKTMKFKKMILNEDVEGFFQKRIDAEENNFKNILPGEKKYDSQYELRKQLSAMPSMKVPVIIAGGSFNNNRHVTKLRHEVFCFLDDLMNNADPEKVFFIIGFTFSGYEKYVFMQNKKRPDGKKFEIFSFVPSVISKKEKEKIISSGVNVRVSIEPSPMGVYKSIAFEIFRRQKSVIIALDGNSAAQNLIQDAKNSRHECRIFISCHSRNLVGKASSLEGYVTVIGDEDKADNVLKYTDEYYEEKIRR